MNIQTVLKLGVCVAGLVLPTIGYAQDSVAPAAAPEAGAGEIIVTALRRSESINKVPLSIVAISGDALTDRNITSTADLARAVPGFTVQESGYDAPVYTLRGVGFLDFALTAGPAVTVYTDEVALPFSVMTKAASLDLERVEVLKGPQGTLYGQNATGGAVNYIAAKPTDSFQAGAVASYARFNTADLQGYVSGPLTDTLKARVAVRTTQGGDWQKSFTRNDSLGEVHQTEGRILVDWAPSSDLKISLNVNGWIDKSDTLAPQLYQVQPLLPASVKPALASYPIPPEKARLADWTPGLDYGRDDYFYQFALRGDYSLSSAVTLTSITAYEHYKDDSLLDFDGTRLQVDDVEKVGDISTFSQELRLNWKADALNLIVGGNYEHDTANDNINYGVGDQSNATIIPGLPLYRVRNNTYNRINTYAVFANADYELTDHLTLHGGARYTQSNRKFYGCTRDGGRGEYAQTFSILQSLFSGRPAVPIGVDQCVSFDANLNSGPVNNKLNENNISWRAVVDYKTDDGALLYASVSKGYKAGSFPTLAAATAIGFNPVTQESLLSYELGAKVPLFEKKLQFNASVFHYDYRDKQVQGRILDPVFGPLNALVNIPKSWVRGAEAQIITAPFAGLRLSAAATYLKTKITRFTGYNQDGVLQNFKGTETPYAPKWQAAGDAQYDWGLSDSLGAFAGASLTYNSSALGQLGGSPIYSLKSFALLDLRAGLKSPGGRWKAFVWGNNVTNTYRYTNVIRGGDTVMRYVAKPVTYGVTVGFNFK